MSYKITLSRNGHDLGYIGHGLGMVWATFLPLFQKTAGWPAAGVLRRGTLLAHLPHKYHQASTPALQNLNDLTLKGRKFLPLIYTPTPKLHQENYCCAENVTFHWHLE